MKGSFLGCCVAGFCGVLTGICVMAARPGRRISPPQENSARRGAGRR